MPTLSLEEYHVGWICALPEELAAAKAMLDEKHEMIQSQDHRDHNSYVLGKIRKHNVAIACMPAGMDGLVAVATVARDMVRTMPALRFGLLVGIGGGVPDLKNNIDIRLGDVVVSQPTGINGGVIQYDKGKATGRSPEDATFTLKGSLNTPPAVLLNALSSIRAEHDMNDSHMPKYLSDMLEQYPKMRKSGYTFPGVEKDLLYCGTCSEGRSCSECEQTLMCRPSREDTSPRIHYGVVASGNLVIKNAGVRDSIRTDFGAKCVEMEAAGLMNNFPCVVIRGICDYADSHKNDVWHKYAATAAAAFAKELLGYISADQALHEKPIQEALGE
jgi:nucleoside phosphorylase